MSRCLKDANITTILASQLDILLGKIVHSRSGSTVAGSSSASQIKKVLLSLYLCPIYRPIFTPPHQGLFPVPPPPPAGGKVMTKTGTLAKAQSKTGGDHGASNQPTFSLFCELMHSVAHQLGSAAVANSSKGRIAVFIVWSGVKFNYYCCFLLQAKRSPSESSQLLLRWQSEQSPAFSRPRRSSAPG